MMYQTCPECGAHLDPGEHCNCEKEKEEHKQWDFSCTKQKEARQSLDLR